MNISDLIATLQDFADEHGDDSPVDIVFQPGYPLAAEVDRVSEVGGNIYVVAKDAYDYAPSDA